MVLFMLMLGAQLTTIFSKVCSLPFGIAALNFKIQLPPFALSVAVMCLVLAMIIFPATMFCPLRPAGRHDNWLVVVVLLLSFAFALR